MKRLITLFILSLFVLSACGKTATAPSDTTDVTPPQEVDKTVENTKCETEEPPIQQPEQEQEQNQEQEQDGSTDEDIIDDATLAQQDETYQIEPITLILEALNTAITMPQISELSNSSLVAAINNELSEAATAMTETLDGSNPVTIDYTIKHQTPRLLSVLYTGNINIENGSIVFLNPVNIYIPTGSVINSETLLSTNALAQTKFNKIFASYAALEGYDFESPEPWMGFYFSEDKLTYFFKESDLSEDYIEISLPLDEVREYFNPLFDF